MTIHRLFVHAGTYKYQNNAIVLTDLQQWTRAPAPLDIVLVYDYDPSIIRQFDALSNDLLRKMCLDDTQTARRDAGRVGLQITGIQIDLDCPTRELPKYAALLRALHSAFRSEHLGLSATTLPTWYSAATMADVADAVDFTVPQYYEADIPRSLDQFKPLSNLSLMTRGLQRADSLGRPFYAGIPAYGHALVYDDRGRLVGVYHDLSVSEAARSPNLHFVGAEPVDRHGQPASSHDYIGEDLVTFGTDELTQGAGMIRYRVIYELPSPPMLAQHLERLRAHRSRNCMGVILFRFPQTDETQTLPLSALADAMRHQTAEPKLHIGIRTASAPWSLIEATRSGSSMPMEMTVSVTNIGEAATFMTRDAVIINLNFDRSGMTLTPLSNVGHSETFASPAASDGRAQENRIIPASPERANVLRVGCCGIASNQTVTLARILIPSGGATRCWGTWSARGVGNYTCVQGTIPITRLTPAASNHPRINPGLDIQ